MNSINDELLKKLVTATGPCLTVVIPRTELSKPGHGIQDAIRKAQKMLKERGGEPEGFLEPLQKISLEEYGGGLIVFRAPDFFEQVRTVAEMPGSVTVEDEFSIMPWIPLKSSDREFYILALALGGVRLLRSTAVSSEEVEWPAGTPRTLEESMSTDQPDHRLDGMSIGGHATGSMKGVMFGTSADAEGKSEYVHHFFTNVERTVRKLLAGSESPLVVAAVDREGAAYARLNTYPHLVESVLVGAPDAFLGNEMRDRALELLRTEVPEPLKKHLETFDKMVGTGHASAHLQDILEAAPEARISELLLRDPHSGTPEADVLNQVVRETIRLGGAVYPVAAEKMPDGAAVAAVFRYAAPAPVQEVAVGQAAAD